MKGRRREDTEIGDLPPDPQPGDYWKLMRPDGRPLQAQEAPENLTGEVWGIVAPNGGHGTLMKHTVREEEDGTISVRQGDGSSNSIKVTQLYEGREDVWHGFIEHGEWTET